MVRISARRTASRTVAWGTMMAALFGAPLVLSQEPSSQEPSVEGPADTSQPSRRLVPSQAVDAPYAGSLFEEPVRPLRRLGLMFDLGTMDGAMMSLVYRPLPWLRFHGGGGTIGVAPGVRVGTVVSPFQNSGWSFSLDGGHFFPGDINGLFAAFAGPDYDDSHLLEHFDYDFVNLQAGWEVERGDLMFFARGGVGLLWTQLPSEDLTRIRNLSSFVDADGSVEALLPSLKIGIIGFL
jgi:hypothetical protein